MTFLRFLALALATAAFGCAGYVESGLRDAAARRTVPTDLRVTFDDHSELMGGDRIEVNGEGVLRWWRVRPGFVSATSAPERHLEGSVALPEPPAGAPTIEARITPEDLLRLVDVLLAVEPWDQRADEDPTRVDRRRAVLEVAIGRDREQCWEWAGEDLSQEGVARVRTWAESAVAPFLGTQPTPPSPTPTEEPAEEPPIELPSAPGAS